MAHSPSKVWEGGVLVERAIETNRGGGERVEVEPTATKPYKTPVPTPQNEEDREKVRELLAAAVKMVDDEAGAENKAVKAAAKKVAKKKK